MNNTSREVPVNDFFTLTPGGGGLQSKTSPATTTLVNLNAWGEPPSLASRHSALTKSLIAELPDIVTLQELYSPYSRRVVDEKLGERYHLHHAYHPMPSFSAASHLPALIVYLLLWQFFPNSNVKLAAILLVPLFILIVWNLVAKLITHSIYKYSGPGWTNFMGGLIAFEKSKFPTSEILSINPFPHSIRGYVHVPATLGHTVGSYLFMFIQHTFFRPGFTVASATDTSGRRILVVNAHLIIGVPNPCRAMQVSSIVKAVESVAEDHDAIVIAGDFNATKKQDPEAFEILERAGFVDSLELMGGSDDEKWHTWSYRNQFVPKEEEEGRIDYVFVRREKGWTSQCGGHEIAFGEKGREVSDHYGLRVEF